MQGISTKVPHVVSEKTNLKKELPTNLVILKVTMYMKRSLKCQ